MYDWLSPGGCGIGCPCNSAFEILSSSMSSSSQWLWLPTRSYLFLIDCLLLGEMAPMGPPAAPLTAPMADWWLVRLCM